MGPWNLMSSSGHGGADHFDDPADAGPVRLNVYRGFLGPHLPDGVSAMPFAQSRCGVWDLALAMKQALNLALQGFLVGLDGQQHVSPLDEAPAKNDWVVWSASAWIKVPSNSRVLCSSLRAARSLDSLVS